METIGKSYKANAYHPDLGNEVATGEVVVTQWVFRFQSEIASADLPVEGLRVTVSESDEDRIIFDHLSQPGWKIYTYDTDILEDHYLVARTAFRKQVRAIYEIEHNWRKLLWITLGVMGVFLLIAVAVFLAGGWTVNYLVGKVPTKYEIELGNSIIDELKEDLVFVKDTNTVRQIDELASRFIPPEEHKKFQFRFHIVEDTDPNAMAFPGGNILVTTGLLNLLETPEELAGVLAHETAHVTQRHGLKHIISAVGPYLVLQASMQSNGSFLNVIGAGSSMLVSQNFSRSYEEAADKVGWEYVTGANINPLGFVEAMKKLQKLDQLPKGRIAKQLASHPPTNDRVEFLEKKYNKLKKKSGFVEV